MGRKSFDLQAIFVEHEGAVHIAETAGQVCVGQRSVADIHTSLQKGIGDRTGDGESKVDEAGGGEAGVESLHELEIQVTFAGEIKVVASCH